jgi:hypothetical protein
MLARIEAIAFPSRVNDFKYHSKSHDEFEFLVGRTSGEAA